MPQRKSRQNADRMVCEVSQSHACPFTLLDELDSIPDDIPCEFILVQPRVAILGLFTQVGSSNAQSIDRLFIVLIETKPSKRHIPVWARYSPLSRREAGESRARALNRGGKTGSSARGGRARAAAMRRLSEA